MFDAPGTGLSPTPSTPLSMTGHARLARGIVDALGHSRVDVLGVSFGGGVAQTMAHLHPERVGALVLAATGCGWGGVPGDLLALSLLATPLRFYSTSYYRAIAPVLFGGEARRHPVALDHYIASRTTRPPSVRGYFGQLLALAGWSSLPWLDQVPHATLILAGDDDPLIPLANAHLMASRIPHAELRIIPGGGHLFLWDDASACSVVIREFLGRLNPGR